MNIFKGYRETKVHIAFILLLLMPISAFCKSDFSAAYQVDDQIISNYDIDQSRKLRNLLTSSNLKRSEIEKIVINDKIKEIYADRLKIIVLEAELKEQIESFLRSNKMNNTELKSLMSLKGIEIETFYNFVKAKY